ncbi:MAG: polyphosphate:AMP phosphotransferase [Gammaproteobacteria bacterium]|nr:polyphosphate:AMP phosphotransferase [Rhodocyclaceae bacterium]MBU3909713.1 polyphosphate:AMP phosphotransferase [Gammaproteobacteria bacterium]MBU3989275.1 polyphosphate:AMP phosphotransferase [Gammaproteobacteria bacterium]MBU4005246.1 polyphosphate:AMP phosphotransferase [Gammaproteobacteria bacterium]MBU4022425.1 polyphosphate:AMP phosphotransferase [Gammaproteobacteria bacterium]
MFESAELGHKLDKETYKKAVTTLRADLLEAQFDLKENKKIPVVVLVSGQDGAGKGETINVLYEWMDPRFISTLAFSEPTDEERERPYMWRYWRALPPKGRVGIFAGSWYSGPIHDRIDGGMTQAQMDQRIDQINRFEAMLVNEGALVLKFWFHLTKDGQKRRLKALEKNPHTAWRVTKWNWDRLKTYDQLQEVVGHVLRMTNTPWAPWIIVEGEDDRYRSLTTGKVILDAIRQRLADPDKQVTPVAPPILPNIDGRDVISELNLEHTLTKKQYDNQLAKWQGRLSELVRDPRFKQHSVICVFEGSDAAGKGGAIRRVTASMDARNYQIVPIAAPTEEERAQPYMWRFWRHVPRIGRFSIFDRSWYGRVLVERVEGFCAEADWLRAYTEINDFEHEISEAGAIVIKFWLQVSKDEQLRRFKEREKIEFKRFKLTDEDWRNREKWDAYHQAVCDMVDRTSSGLAPWTLVEANDKGYARVKVIRTICERLEAALDATLPTTAATPAKGKCRGKKGDKKG